MDRLSKTSSEHQGWVVTRYVRGDDGASDYQRQGEASDRPKRTRPDPSAPPSRRDGNYRDERSGRTSQAGTSVSRRSSRADREAEEIERENAALSAQLSQRRFGARGSGSERLGPSSDAGTEVTTSEQRVRLRRGEENRRNLLEQLGHIEEEPGSEAGYDVPERPRQDLSRQIGDLSKFVNDLTVATRAGFQVMGERIQQQERRLEELERRPLTELAVPPEHLDSYVSFLKRNGEDFGSDSFTKYDRQIRNDNSDKRSRLSRSSRRNG